LSKGSRHHGDAQASPVDEVIGYSVSPSGEDTATMKCQVVNTEPAAGGNMKVIGAVHPTQASAQTALTAEKTCAK